MAGRYVSAIYGLLVKRRRKSQTRIFGVDHVYFGS
jgi:hypothetical protein